MKIGSATSRMKLFECIRSDDLLGLSGLVNETNYTTQAAAERPEICHPQEGIAVEPPQTCSPEEGEGPPSDSWRTYDEPEILPMTPWEDQMPGLEFLDDDIGPSPFKRTPMTPWKDQMPAVECVDDEIGPSPLKRRKQVMNGNESPSRRRCFCRKSECPKLYCECFAAGGYCSEDACTCKNCCNSTHYDDTVLDLHEQIESRNPLAFSSKIDEGRTRNSLSSKHKRGCNCRKSKCLKKYCVCYQGKVGCHIGCRCENCLNSFGTKPGNEAMDTDAAGRLSSSAGTEVQFSQAALRLAVHSLSNCLLEFGGGGAHGKIGDALDVLRDAGPPPMLEQAVKAISPNGGGRIMPPPLFFTP